MSDYRFTVTASGPTAVRNRGYDDALAGRDPAPPDDDDLRRTYWQGYRRGREARGRKVNDGDD